MEDIDATVGEIWAERKLSLLEQEWIAVFSETKCLCESMKAFLFNEPDAINNVIRIIVLFEKSEERN